MGLDSQSNPFLIFNYRKILKAQSNNWAFSLFPIPIFSFFGCTCIIRLVKRFTYLYVIRKKYFTEGDFL